MTATDDAAATTLRVAVLYTDADGRARFRDDALALADGTPAARLSALAPAGGWQFRRSPAGFRSGFHCTGTPQWLVVLQGRMEIGLRFRQRAANRVQIRFAVEHA